MHNKFIVKMIDNYKKNISPHSEIRCKYHPSCSMYAKAVYSRFNFFKASALALYRILRCNPFSKGGYDPAPYIMKRRKKDD